jgi:hypothetical protein
MGDRFGRTASATKESAQIGVISKSTDLHDISAACGGSSGSAKSIPACLRLIGGAWVESLWPQNSVSKVAVRHLPTALDFERFGFEPRHF